MKLKQSIINTVRKVDRYSPWPLFYPFVMTKNEKHIFNEKIKNSENYLEFGLGGSTLHTLQRSGANIYSVESSHEWINLMRKYFLIRFFENKRLTIHHVDIGATREWGNPISTGSKNRFPDYSSSIFHSIDGSAVDLALIDGRFRVACTLKVILECNANNNLEILIHDFWNRENYHLVLKYLDVVDRVDSLGVFSIKKDVDLKSAASEYENYKFISE